MQFRHNDKHIGETNFILRIKKQETRLTLHVHDDDDDDDDKHSIIHHKIFHDYYHT